MEKPALLMLDDGACFEGLACGAQAEAAGEAVFTTGMAGYQETLTDPSFSGQLVTFTAAHIGNYGISKLDDEAPGIRAAGAIFHDLFSPREAASFPHWRAAESLDARLAREGVTGIRDVDTRALTLHLREHGARNAFISALDTDRPSLLRRARELPAMQGRDLAARVTCQAPYDYAASGMTEQAGIHTVAVIDYGVKRSILACLAASGMRVKVWPATVTAEELLAARPDGVLLSNGPGDPQPCAYAVATIRGLLGKMPMFGICLGHQLLGLALGAKTYKLPFGHHGANHPVRDCASGRVHITSQNHGFCLDPDSLPRTAIPSHWNLNDNTLEGITVTDLPAFSVQFHPEAAPGPTDAQGLFARFRAMIAETRASGAV